MTVQQLIPLFAHDSRCNCGDNDSDNGSDSGSEYGSDSDSGSDSGSYWNEEACFACGEAREIVAWNAGRQPSGECWPKNTPLCAECLEGNCDSDSEDEDPEVSVGGN